MSSVDEWADYLDPFGTDPALPDGPQRVALERISTTLSEEGLWDGPSPGLRQAVLEQAEAEAEGRLVGRPRTGAGSPSRRLRRTRVGPLLASAACLVAAIALAGSLLLWPRDGAASHPLAGTALAPGAHASALLEPKPAGVEITLEIKGLAPAPAGAYYAAWLRGPGGTVAVGSFHWHKGGVPILLWSGVDAAHYPLLFVTLQHEGDPPTPSEQIVLSGAVG